MLGTAPLAIAIMLKTTDIMQSMTVMIHAQPLAFKRPQARTNQIIPSMIATLPAIMAIVAIMPVIPVLCTLTS